MKTIIEEPLESLQYAISSNLKEPKYEFDTNLLQISRVTNKENQVTNYGVDTEIYQFIEDIQRHQLKLKNNKGASLKNYYGKDKSIIETDKNKKLNLGLSDNQTVDSENKLKAQKGLLMLLNKMSNGEFVPEIKNYFKKKNEDLLQSKKEEILLSNINDLEADKKKAERVSILPDKLEVGTSLIKDEDEEHEVLTTNNKYKTSQVASDIANLKKAGMYNKSKYFKEDQGMDDFDILIYYFSKNEVNEYKDLKRNAIDEEGFRIKLNKMQASKDKRVKFTKK